MLGGEKGLGRGVWEGAFEVGFFRGWDVGFMGWERDERVEGEEVMVTGLISCRPVSQTVTCAPDRMIQYSILGEERFSF